MEMEESEKTQWYEILVAGGEYISQVRYCRIDYVVIIVCIKIIFSKVYSYIMVLLYSEKNSTATNKPGAESCQSTNQPIFFCYIIWMQNGNIFDDCLNIIHITIDHESNTWLVILAIIIESISF